jgi:hypothetical protein
VTARACYFASSSGTGIVTLPVAAPHKGYLERWVLGVFRIMAQGRYEYPPHAELSGPQNRLVDARAGLGLGISCTIERVVVVGRCQDMIIAVGLPPEVGEQLILLDRKRA